MSNHNIPPTLHNNTGHNNVSRPEVRQRRSSNFTRYAFFLGLILGGAAVYAFLTGTLRPNLCQISLSALGMQMADCPIDPSLPGLLNTTPTPNPMIVVITPTPIIRDKGAILLKTKKLSDLLTYRKSYSDQITLSQAASSANMQQLLNWAEQFTHSINYDVQQHGRDTVIVDFQGTITYGVILGELTEYDISISSDQKDITITLPPSKILQVDVDLEKSRILAHDQGFLAQPLLNIDVDALHVGELQILKQCTSDDLLAAAQQAQTVLRHILALSDFRNVTITSTQGACGTTLPSHK